MSERSFGVQTMRQLDARIGLPLCRLLTLVRRLGGGPKAPAGPSQRILVVKLAEQGATVAAYPALRLAVDMVGAEHVYVAVFAANRPVLDELGLVPRENVLTVRTTGPLAFATDLLRLVIGCRRRRIDAAVDFEFFSRVSAVIVFLSGATRRVGLHSFAGEGPNRGDLMTHRVSGNPTQHVSHTFLSLIAALDQPVDRLPALDLGPWPAEPPPQVVPTAAELGRMRALLGDELGWIEGPLIVMNPNCGDLVPLRRWPAGRYAELADELGAAIPDLRIVLTGTVSEAEEVAEVARQIGAERCASLAGRTTLRELLVLYSLADVLVTNDSGPAHFATLTPIEVVVLFGPETPQVFGPVSDRCRPLWAGIACSPCVNMFNNRRSSCQDNVCMQRLSTASVRDEVLAACDAHRSR